MSCRGVKLVKSCLFLISLFRALFAVEGSKGVRSWDYRSWRCLCLVSGKENRQEGISLALLIIITRVGLASTIKTRCTVSSEKE
jgi:hypothetical protein